MLKHNGEYWCYRTGRWTDGRIFAILHSPDLIHWRVVGGAMAPLTPDQLHYWAPEVFYCGGRFYLYYSTGNEETMALRVAVSEQPQGPFIDSGRVLTTEKFAIDAHVFEDDDGTRYLFYATDFLDHQRVGTGTVFDRLLDPYTLAGQPQPVSRAQYNWQIYDPNRQEKGGACWHTLEGSTTLKHRGRYYQMFSGGNFHNKSYGVGYAVTDDLSRREEWLQPIDGESRLPVLRSVPGALGPGHNSVVLGPDNRQFYCVYHVIKQQERFERIMAIDRLEWLGENLVVIGPTTDSQPGPVAAVQLGLPDRVDGVVRLDPEGYVAVGGPAGNDAAAWYATVGPAFLFETMFLVREGAACGLHLHSADQQPLLFLRITPDEGRASLVVQGLPEAHFSLPLDFVPYAAHRLRLEVDRRSCRLEIDHSALRWEGILPGMVAELGLAAAGGVARFTANHLTRGFENLFANSDLDQTGWSCLPDGAARVSDGLLDVQPPVGQVCQLATGIAFLRFEWVMNVRLAVGGSCSTALVDSKDNTAFRIDLYPDKAVWHNRDGSEYRQDMLPSAGEFIHLRLWKDAEALYIYVNGRWHGPFDVSQDAASSVLEFRGSGAALAMARLTEIAG